MNIVAKILSIMFLCLNLSSVTMTIPGFTIPTTFNLQTALDKISIGPVCQTLTFAAGIILLFKALDTWSTSNPRADRQPQFTGDNSTINQAHAARNNSALKFLLSGCLFTTSGFIQKYSHAILGRSSFLKRLLVLK